MPIPHRQRAQTTKGGRKKPPSAELTSPETMKFVSDSLNSKLKRQAPASKSRSSKKCRPKPAEVCRSDEDHEQCARCKFAYGDKKDPHLCDNWERCSKCKKMVSWNLCCDRWFLHENNFYVWCLQCQKIQEVGLGLGRATMCNNCFFFFSAVHAIVWTCASTFIYEICNYLVFTLVF